MNASDGASGDNFGSSATISVDTLIVGYPYKYVFWGAAYVFVLAGYGLWDEGTKLVSRNGITSGDWFGNAVDLSGDMYLIGAYVSDEKGNDSGAAYIFHRVNGV